VIGRNHIFTTQFTDAHNALFVFKQFNNDRFTDDKGMIGFIENDGGEVRCGYKQSGKQDIGVNHHIGRFFQSR